MRWSVLVSSSVRESGAEAVVIVERSDHTEEQRVVVGPWQKAS